VARIEFRTVMTASSRIAMTMKSATMYIISP
jgi:hypothetical protein